MSKLRDMLNSPKKRVRTLMTVATVAIKTVLILMLCAALALGLVLTVSSEMVRVTSDRIVTQESLTQTLEKGDYDCILVLGAGLKSDNVTPSDMLYDRVSVAVELYQASEGKVPLLMSGDHTGDYNEVAVMKSVAMEMGAASEDVFLDHEGYSTIESLRRAKEMFGAKKIVIVTQEYHLHRALHIARELGVSAVGVSADLRPYRNQMRYDAREVLARFKDLYMAAKVGFDMTRKDYKSPVDQPVNLNGNGDLTNEMP